MNGEHDQAGVKSLTIDDLDLTNRAYNCLRREGIVHVCNIVAKTREELMTIRGMGVTSVRDIEKALTNLGLHLGMRDVGLTELRHSEDAAKLDLDAFIGVMDWVNRNGVRNVNDLTRLTPEEILAIPEIDQPALEIIKTGLSRWGLRLGMDARDETRVDRSDALEIRHSCTEIAAHGRDITCDEALTFKDELLQILPRLLTGTRPSGISCFIAYHGVSGDSGLTLQEIADDGANYGFRQSVTRERVRQVISAVERKLKMSARRARFARWESAVEETRRNLPTSVPSLLDRFGYESVLKPEKAFKTLVLCADILALHFPFDIRTLNGIGPLIVDPADDATLANIERLPDIARGPYSDMSEVVRRIGSSKDLLYRTIDASPKWEFLDDDCRYFWKRPFLPPQNYSITGNPILTCLCKIFSVTRRAKLLDLADSIIRDKMLRMGDSTLKIPIPVLQGVAKRSGLFDVSDDEIVRKADLEWCSVGRRDKALLRICVDCGRVVTSDVIHTRLVREGLTSENANITIAYSPFLVHSQPGSWSRRGIYKFVVNPEEIDLDGDNGQTGSDDEVLEECLRVPISSRTRMSGKYYGTEPIGLDGEWNVQAGDGQNIGRITVSDRAIVGLAPVISALGLKKNDVLKLRRDTDARVLFVVS